MEKHNVFPVDYENAKIAFRNFAGIGSKYNKEGDRNFVWIIDDPGFAKDMRDDGWNIKVYVNDESLIPGLLEDGWNQIKLNLNIKNDVEYRLQVALNYNAPPSVPPVKIFTYANGVQSQIFEDTVAELDSAVFRNVDLTVRPSWWHDDISDGWHIKAYLQEARITLETSRWDAKYSQYNT